MRPVLLLGGLAAAIAGCSAHAGEDRRAADEPGEVRVRLDKEAIQAFLARDRHVNVSGTAKRAVVPDVADVSIGVSSARATAPEALAANNRAMAGLVEALKARGVAAKDIQTSQVSISPQYSRPAEFKPGVPPEATVPTVVGFDVSNTVRVTARDPAKLGELIDAATRAGSNQIYVIAFRIDDREAVLAELREKAFDSARAKAELYARRAGMGLGPVVQITEADGGWPIPSPMAPGPMAMMAPAPAPEGPMPINAGEQEVSLSVTVSFELKSPR